MELSELDIDLRKKISTALSESSGSGISVLIKYKLDEPDVSGELPDWYIRHIDDATDINSFPLVLIEDYLDPSEVFSSARELVERLNTYDGGDFEHYIDLFKVDAYPDELITFRINRVGIYDYEIYFLGVFLSEQDLFAYCFDSFSGYLNRKDVGVDEEQIFKEYQRLWSIQFNK